MKCSQAISKLIEKHANVQLNLSRRNLIAHSVKFKGAVASPNGALVVWNPEESTGRSPQDTMYVKRPESEKNIDWTSPNNLPCAPETFEMIFEDAIKTLKGKERLYVTDRVVGADSRWALPTRTITDRALTSLFVDNMFRAVPKDINKSIFAKEPFTILALPYDKLDREKYAGKLRKLGNGKTSNMAIIMDLDNRIGIVFGSAYCGSVKKLMFSVMNYYLPMKGILPLHCSANEGKKGDCALLLGLSGTGKTTLSADPNRALLGDDEHGWDEHGVANFENGCFAKLINLRKEKEPEIYNAVFGKKPYLSHGSIIENAMMYPDGTFDLDDARYTENSRASFLLSTLSNIKKSSVSGHPKTILFLTADANGVLPPIAKLTPEQAMLWFIMGYTSKLAGTETGIKEPASTFSRFFGGPFMPCNPQMYAGMLGEKMKEHGSVVYLVNTGWSGGPYGVGSRMDITLTRTLVDAALSGKLAKVEYEEDKLFHLMVPKTCPGVDAKILKPVNTWNDKKAYEERAKKLAGEFSAYFDKAFSKANIDPKIVKQCPGK